MGACISGIKKIKNNIKHTECEFDLSSLIFSRMLSSNIIDSSEIDNNIVNKADSYISSVPESIYKKLIGGEYNNVENSVEIYFIMLIMFFHYGKNSAEYLNVKENFFMYSSVNYGWLETIIESIKNQNAMYVPISDNKNCIFNLAKTNYTSNTDFNIRVALVGDWGAGTKYSFNVMKAISSLNPDFMIHLGDVYYSGTVDEYNTNFINPIKKYLLENNPKCKVFNLTGNHDMYSGGEGFYHSLNVFEKSNGIDYKQQTSYFILQNDYVQIHGFDTGFYDREIDIINVLSKTSNQTCLHEDEYSYHSERMIEGKKKGKKIITLAHHPFFVINDGIFRDDTTPKKIPVNEKLYKQFDTNLANIDAHYCGHIHNIMLFDDYQFPNGCKLNQKIIGHGGCYNNSDIKKLYEYDENLSYDEYNRPTMKEGDWKISFENNNINLGFCVLDITKNLITASYYIVMFDGKCVLKYTEQI